MIRLPTTHPCYSTHCGQSIAVAATEFESRFSGQRERGHWQRGSEGGLQRGENRTFCVDSANGQDSNATGLDAHSVFADPRFVDAANGDYRPAPDGPAHTIRPDGGPIGADLTGGQPN
ncbi:MAG: hypothetical protein ACYTG0_16370 [Planctomycetota bacterium]